MLIHPSVPTHTHFYYSTVYHHALFVPHVRGLPVSKKKKLRVGTRSCFTLSAKHPAQTERREREAHSPLRDGMGDARTTSASRYVYAPTSPRVLQTVVDRTHDRAPDMHVKFAA